MPGYSSTILPGPGSGVANEADAVVPSGPWQSVYAAPSIRSYPVLPPFPMEQEQRVEREKIREKPPLIWQMGLHISALKLLPLGVGCGFVVVQLLLVARFICKAVAIDSAIAWVNSVYALSEIALLPFRALLPPLEQALFLRIEPYTILAIVCYGLCSRLLVRLLKVLVGIHISAYGQAKQTLQTGNPSASDVSR